MHRDGMLKLGLNARKKESALLADRNFLNFAWHFTTVATANPADFR